MPLQATSGAASYDAFGGGGAAVEPVYIEQIFSTYLYTGNGSTQTITNGIDLSTKGGLVWVKARGTAGYDHLLFDTIRGTGSFLSSNLSSSASTNANTLTAFNTTGFSLGNDSGGWGSNISGVTTASWTFRKQPKFFDVVTYTGNGSSNRQISHSLESVPACMIIKRTDSGGSRWNVYHRAASATPQNGRLALNTTDAYAEYPTIPSFDTLWNLTQPTSTNFTVGSNADVNASGGTYIAYLFAHDAGGFGLTGTDNVISCGSYTGDGTTDGSKLVSLGYEPQWVLVKRTDSSTNGGWHMIDTIRGMPTATSASSITALLLANSAAAEVLDSTGGPSATGFRPVASLTNTNGASYIYIAIRRGPMKVPTTGTSVFYPTLYAGNGAATQTITGASFAPDLSLLFDRNRDGLTYTPWTDRLRGGKTFLESNNTNGETTNSANGVQTLNMNGVTIAAGNSWNSSTFVPDGLTYLFGRAPSFMDVVCYTGTGSARTVSHNLAAVPELMIVKSRSLAAGGAVYTASTGNANYLRLFSTSSDSGETATSFWNSTTPTASVFSLGTANNVNGNTNTYVAYLFATCPGVSKVGSYTGTGATQTINCGFTGGARFVLIKKSTSTAPDRDWYVWDTARGMVSGTDPSLKLNTTAAEVNANDVYTITTGFQLVSSSDYVNASGVTYIFLAIA